VPALETWRSPDDVFVIHYPAPLLEEIRADIMMAMHGPGRGGIETGGILLGGRDEAGEFVLEGWRPIRCEHSRGSSFQLSPRDVAALSCQVEGLSGGGTGGVVGWYVAHFRGALGLRTEELDLHGRVFPQQASLFVTIAPEKFGDAAIRFYLIQSGPEPSATAVPGLLRLAPAPGLTAAPAEERLSGPRLVRTRGASPLRWLWPVAAAMALVVGSVIGWQVWSARQPKSEAAAAVIPPSGDPVEVFTLHVEPVGDRLEISWEPPEAGAGNFTATLTVVDQDRAFVRPLTPSELALGRIRYTRPTTGIRVSLLLESPNARPRLARTQYQAPGAE